MNVTPKMRCLGLLLLLGTLFLSGCGSMTQTAGMAASLINVTLKEEPAGGTTAVITLQLQNEDIVGFAVERMSHKIYFDDGYIGEGVSKEPFAMARLGTTTREVTARLEDPAVVARVRALIEKGRANYRIESRFFLTVQEEKLTFTSTSRGTVDFHALVSGAAPTSEKK